MLLSWVAFPLVLGLLCGGWGTLVGELAGSSLDGALRLPCGFAAIIVVAGLITAWSALAPACVGLIAVGGAAGTARWALRARTRRPDAWAALVAVGLVVVFGAPVLASGQATFAGYLKLDDTATWLSIVDRVLSHGRSLSGLAPSTYALNLHSYLVGMGYPLGAFEPWGIAGSLVGADPAWVLQPYLAFCGAMVGLVLYAAVRPVLGRPWQRALVAGLAGQSALLFGYAQWGGVKECSGAVTLALLGVSVAWALPQRGGAGRRAGATVALAAAAAVDTLGPGAAPWVAIALAGLAVGWLWAGRSDGRPAPRLAAAALPAGVAAVLILPVWLELSAFLHGSNATDALSGSGALTALANLYHPLSALQLAGPWPVGDFRLTASAGAALPGLLAVAAGLVVWGAVAVRRPSANAALIAYAVTALGGTLLVWLAGTIPWDVAKALAMSSPVLPALALVGGLLAVERVRALGVAVVTVLGAALLWSNVLAYHDVTLAPRPRLAELERIAPLLSGRGPTFVDEYEVYADRHFLRDGDPTEPAEYRPYLLPLVNGTLLTQSAWADLDAFPVSTLLGFRSIVTPTSPVTSRPSSLYSLRWRGRSYELWQRPADPAARVVLHVPFGDSSVNPYCGRSTTTYAPLCAVMPVATAPCSLVRRLAATARADGAQLVAYQRPAPIVARADQTRWPRAWAHDPSAHTLSPTTPGTLVAHILVSSGQPYALWLGGSFGRGFVVTVDGRPLGRVQNQLGNIGAYVEVGQRVLGPGVHTIALRYPQAGLAPGSGWRDTTLATIALQPLLAPATRMLRVTPANATQLCGRTLDWIELVSG